MRYHLHYIDTHGQVYCSVQMDDPESAEEMLRRQVRNKELVKVWEYLTSVEDKVMIFVGLT